MKTLTDEAARDVALVAGGSAWVETMTFNCFMKASSLRYDWWSSLLEASAFQTGSFFMTPSSYQANIGRLPRFLQIVNASVPCACPNSRSGRCYETFGNGALEGTEKLLCFNGSYFFPVPYHRDEVTDASSANSMCESKVTIGDPKGKILSLLDSDYTSPRGRTVTVSSHMVISGKPLPGVTFSEATRALANASLGSMFCRDEGTVVISEPIVSRKYLVGSVTHDGIYCSFNIKSSCTLRHRFPPRTITKARCQWSFESCQCSLEENTLTEDGEVAGETLSCDKTIANCGRYSNLSHIGCFPGCGNGGLSQ